MPAVAAITLADAQATPVNHSFVPLGPDSNGVWWFEDQSAASAIGYWKVSVELKRPGQPQAGESSANRVFRVRVALHEPVLETISNSTVSGITPAPTIAYTSRGFIEYVLPERSTLQNRKDLRKMLGLLNSDTNITAVVETLQNIY